MELCLNHVKQLLQYESSSKMFKEKKYVNNITYNK
jgi:hypothetical protein